MTNMSAQDREARIKKLEGFRDDWQKMITENDSQLAQLKNMKITGIDAYDEAICRAMNAGRHLAEAKSNIEETINRVSGGCR
jgi:hypothetical protein